MISKNRKPTHPGQILLREFLEPMEMSQAELARKIKVPVQQINALIHGKRNITAKTALLLSSVLKTTPEFWMNLQNAYDLYKAKIKVSDHPFFGSSSAPRKLKSVHDTMNSLRSHRYQGLLKLKGRVRWEGNLSKMREDRTF